MKPLVVVLFVAISFDLAAAQMVRNDSIGNDPDKETLCASRAKGKTVPFEVDSRYVARSRALHPDSTFIAIDGSSPQLVECFLSEGTGRFEPAISAPEQSFWHLIKPRQFEPGIGTSEGVARACNVCLRPAPDKINRPDFDHAVCMGPHEINLGSPLYHPGISVGGKTADRYDVAVKGTAFYKSSGPDLASVKFTCLLSPMLDLKAIQVDASGK